jgi:hypothetical protein
MGTERVPVVTRTEGITWAVIESTLKVGDRVLLGVDEQ